MGIDNQIFMTIGLQNIAGFIGVKIHAPKIIENNTKVMELIVHIVTKIKDNNKINTKIPLFEVCLNDNIKEKRFDLGFNTEQKEDLINIYEEDLMKLAILIGDTMFKDLGGEHKIEREIKPKINKKDKYVN